MQVQQLRQEIGTTFDSIADELQLPTKGNLSDEQVQSVRQVKAKMDELNTKSAKVAIKALSDSKPKQEQTPPPPPDAEGEISLVSAFGGAMQSFAQEADHASQMTGHIVAQRFFAGTIQTAVEDLDRVNSELIGFRKEVDTIAVQVLEHEFPRKALPGKFTKPPKLLSS